MWDGNTVEAGGGSYPSPSEYAEKTINGTVVLTYNLNADVPINWNDEDIIDNIKNNIEDYIDINDYLDIEVDI